MSVNLQESDKARAVVPSLEIDPFGERFLANPYAHHEALREVGPVFWLEALGCYGMARFEEVQDALRNHQTFCSGRGVGLADFAKEAPFRPPSLLLEVDPPLHDRTRSLMNKVVSLRALKTLRPRWEAIADRLVGELIERRSFDAVRDLAEVFQAGIGVAEGAGLLVEVSTQQI